MEETGNLSQRVAVVVCYRKDLALLERCIASLKRQSTGVDLFLIDDCSKESPTFEADGALGHVELIRNESWSGYTRSANRGLQAARGADVIVLLNSDAELPAGGIGKLAQALTVGSDTGLAGPLSNAASWQSVPRRFKPGGGWATNAGLADVGVGAMDEVVSGVSARDYPRVPLLNGFCLAIRREVMDEVGFLDEVNFPIGYGEENDYVIRAQEAGFKSVVADDTFVYHAKSRSFGNLRRWWYSRRGGIALAKKWGQARIEAMCEEMRGNETLAKMRRKIAEELKRRGHGVFDWD